MWCDKQKFVIKFGVVQEDIKEILLHQLKQFDFLNQFIFIIPKKAEETKQ